MKVVIIGGIAGGASAAARLRRLDEKAEIILFERSANISSATCGLPYFIGNVIKNKAELNVQTVEGFVSRFSVDVRINTEVTEIDPNKKIVTYKNNLGKTGTESYDKLILSPGAYPFIPQNWDNIKGLFVLRSQEDGFAICDYLKNEKPKNAVVVGGGFIGMEMAENLLNIGLSVTIVEKMPHLLPVLDQDMASFVHSRVKRAGIKMMLGDEVSDITQKEGEILIKFKDGNSISTDMVILSLGVVPENKLAKESGLELDIKGTIKVNEYMQTSNADIYAIGDAVAVKNYVSGKISHIPLAGPANKQGRIAADNICGRKTVYKGAQATAIVKVFDVTAAVTGLSEKEAKEICPDATTVMLMPLSHAGYYPGGQIMALKTIFDQKTGKIFGAQIVGGEGVDKRIDILATAIFLKADIRNLKDLDLAYAPPYASAKDPINMVGFVAENIMSGLHKQIGIEDLDKLEDKSKVNLIDVRTPKEYAAGTFEGFENIPLDDLRNSYDKIDKSKPVYVACRVGIRGYIDTRILEQDGFDAHNLAGGYLYYDSVMKDRK